MAKKKSLTPYELWLITRDHAEANAAKSIEKYVERIDEMLLCAAEGAVSQADIDIPVRLELDPRQDHVLVDRIITHYRKRGFEAYLSTLKITISWLGARPPLDDDAELNR